MRDSFLSSTFFNQLSYGCARQPMLQQVVSSVVFLTSEMSETLNPNPETVDTATLIATRDGLSLQIVM